MNTSIVWFREDLRIADNPALSAAAARGPVIGVVIDSATDAWRPRGANRHWWRRNAMALAKALDAFDVPLFHAQGAPAEVLAKLAEDTGASAVCFNIGHTPATVAEDEAVTRTLRGRVEVLTHRASLLTDPAVTLTRSQTPFKVFTPFYKYVMAQPAPRMPLPRPAELAGPAKCPAWPRLNALPAPDWAVEIDAVWAPGEKAALDRLDTFLAGASAYPDERDLPAIDGTSMMSPYLQVGVISPYQLWHALDQHAAEQGRLSVDDGEAQWRRQLIWREFAYSLLHHFPETVEEPLRPEFNRFDWVRDNAALKRWQRGETGYPIVDAGMRQLWQTGWMHNRVRMIVASFLIKDLGIHWLEGARWFWDTLLDADLANNTLGWQWVAGCGADAAPYFRIFNPVTQSEKFDPDGVYLRRWLPELDDIPAKHIHAPWQAGPLILAAAGVTLDEQYPSPMVDHGQARANSLARYHAMKSERSGK